MVKLLYNTPLSVCVQAGRTAWQSFHKGGNYETPTDNITQEDENFLDRIANKHKHHSVIEHLVYSFEINDISRALLQELSRHRLQSLTVKSTRYTIKELKKEDEFTDFDNEYDYKRASKYLVWTKNRDVDITSFFALEDLRDNIKKGISNDLVKYSLPESYKTSLVQTINARSLRNFLELRTSKSALWEIRNLAFEIYKAIPDSHKFLFNQVIEEV
jgi:thymidylate synthase (FAD)